MPTYIVRTVADVVQENAGEGIDTVRTATHYTLGDNLENLVLTSTSDYTGTGNALDNQLLGNTGNNTLRGGAGNDRLQGLAGRDILEGGSGNDIYVLGRGDGADTVRENDATPGNRDVAAFGADIGFDQLWWRKSGVNLEISVIGTADRMTITNWYLGSQYHVEQFQTSDGLALQENQVQNLVQAMAAFAPPPAGETRLSAGYQAALAPVLVANWQ